MESGLVPALKEVGRVDVLVNNAGYSQAGSVEMMTMDAMKAQMETNLFGVIRCQKAVLPYMRQQKSGKIINISSVGGIWGQPFNDIYCASKFALEGLAESQAPLFRTFGVYVSCVEPGAIKSAFWSNAHVPEASAMPPEYMKPMQSTMAAYGKSAGAGQTPEEQFSKNSWLMISDIWGVYDIYWLGTLYILYRWDHLGSLRMITIQY